MAGDPTIRGRLNVAVGVRQSRGTRDAGGKFTRLQTKIADVNAKMAAELAQEIAHTLDFTRLESRRSAQSGKLKAALLAPENRRADKFGFGVGIPEFMNEAAPYWRIQNDGTTRFVGRTVRFIRNKGAGYGFPDPHGAGIREINAQVRGGKANGRVQNEYGQFRSRANQEGVIKRPIRAQHFFEKGLAAFESSDRIRFLLDYALREAGFQPRK